MRRREGLAILLIVFCVSIAAFLAARRAKAQVSTTTVTFGFSTGPTFNLNATQFLAIPPCSAAAKCAGAMRICEAKSGETANCILIHNGGANWFNLSLEQTITDATGGTSTKDYPFGSLRMDLPPAETLSVP